MATEKSDYQQWDEPVFPLSAASDLTGFFDQIDADVIKVGTKANRPTAAEAGRVYLAHDEKRIYRDTGTSWNDITPESSYNDEQAQDAVGTITDTTLAYDDATPALGVAATSIDQTHLSFDPATQKELDDGLATKSDTTHNHDSTYSALGHNHDSAYAALSKWPDHGQATRDVIKSYINTDERAFGVLEPRTPAASPQAAGATAASLMASNEYDDNIHAQSDGSGLLTYDDAVQYAEDRGGRLPTLEEVEGLVTAGSGSGYDNEVIWTQTRAGPDSYYVQYGRYTNFTSDPRTTRATRAKTDTAYVRWVAEADQSNLPAAVNAHTDQVFLAEGTNTNINAANYVAWNTTVINDAAYSFDGTIVTFQEAGTYEIDAAADFASTVARTNPNLLIQYYDGAWNWAGVLGRSGYMRNASGHNHSSVHPSTVKVVSAGDQVRVRGSQEAQSETVVPDRAQFYIKKLNR